MTREEAIKEENACGSPLERVSHLQATVGTLLRFASETTGLSVPAEVVQVVTPLLRLQAEAVTEDQEIELWKGCDALTQVIKPTTLESATTAIQLSDWNRTEKADQKKCLPSAASVHRRSARWIWLTAVILLFYIFTQGYTIALSTAINDLKSLTKALDDATAEMRLFQAEAGKRTDPCAPFPSLEQAEQKAMNFSARIDAVRNVLFRLLKPLEILLRPLGHRPEKRPGVETGMASLKQVLTSSTLASRFDVYARIIHEAFVGYFIPLLLGLLGASAYVTRQISGAIKDHTYQAGRAIQDRVRLIQGATFGTLAGVLTSALQVEPSASSVSIQAVALVCGYNSEMVFRAMDAAGLRFKEFLKEKPSEG